MSEAFSEGFSKISSKIFSGGVALEANPSDVPSLVNPITIYAAITNHGFGHATRTCALLNFIAQHTPNLRLILCANVPKWLLDEYLPWSLTAEAGRFTHRHRFFDVGVLQTDSLYINHQGTLDNLEQLVADHQDLVASEVAFLQETEVDLVFGDMPPLLTEIAHQVGVPCWMAGNFGWDFIYRDFGKSFGPIADWFSSMYAQCDRLFRLPFHAPMANFPVQQDVGWTGGLPRVPADQLRARFGLDPQRPTALLTFGGLSLAAIPYDNLTRFSDWQFITFDRQAPDLPNLTLAAVDGLRPVDLMPLCDRVITKPGYGTLSEISRVGVPVVCLTRTGFAESPILLEGVRQTCNHIIIEPEDFYTGSWDFLTAAMTPPTAPPEARPGHYGELEIFTALREYFGG
jgi:hypothetical protein